MFAGSVAVGLDCMVVSVCSSEEFLATGVLLSVVVCGSWLLVVVSSSRTLLFCMYCLVVCDTVFLVKAGMVVKLTKL